MAKVKKKRANTNNLNSLCFNICREDESDIQCKSIVLNINKKALILNSIGRIST
jgi:hypothetical protein